MKYIDTHSHLQFPQYDADRAEVLKRMHDADVGTITIGTDIDSSRNGIELAGKVENMWASVGVHPNDSEEAFDADAFEKILSPKVVAVGECGLDYFRSSSEKDGERQKKNFRAQIEFALKHNLALMLHVRPSANTQDAHEDALAILESYKDAHTNLRGTSHFFTGSLDIAKRYWALGFAVSIPGVVTFTNACDEVVRAAPKELILSETDAPYAAPVPFRGKRNEPAFVVEIVKRLAELRGEEVVAMARQIAENTTKIFNIGGFAAA